MRLSIFSAFALFATFAVAGCAVDPTEQTEQTDDTQQAAGSITDARLKDAVQSDNDFVVNRTPQAALHESSRLYDFSQVPRVGQRAPYEINIQETLQNVAIPHSAVSGVAGQIRNGTDTSMSVSGANP